MDYYSLHSAQTFKLVVQTIVRRPSLSKSTPRLFIYCFGLGVSPRKDLFCGENAAWDPGGYFVTYFLPVLWEKSPMKFKIVLPGLFYTHTHRKPRCTSPRINIANIYFQPLSDLLPFTISFWQLPGRENSKRLQLTKYHYRRSGCNIHRTMQVFHWLIIEMVYYFIIHK